MLSRERVLRVINHQEADRVPIDLGGTMVTSITQDANKQLKDYLGLNTPAETIMDICQGIVVPSEALLQRFQADFRRVALRPPGSWTLRFQEDGSFINEWGIRFKEFGYYYDVVDFPLKEPDAEVLARYPWPDPKDPARIASLRQEVEELYHHSPYAIIADMFVGGVFLQACRLRGFDQFLADMVVRPAFATTLMDKLVDLYIEFYRQYLAVVGKYVQIVAVADDLGTQTRMMISPKMYRELIKPRHCRLYGFIKEHTDAKILMHSDGSIYPVIRDLHEVGVDILEPVQTSAAQMDIEVLKREFGSRLVFHGAIDIQQVLSQKSASEVVEEVRRVLRILGPGGGYILAPTHNIQPDTKPENILALYDAALKYGMYPISC